MKLKDCIGLFKFNRTLIIRYWLQAKQMQIILKSKDIDLKFFIQKYAINIFDYYMDVALKKETIGTCPVLIELLKYFKDKDITTKELFLICNGFKNALIKNSYELNCNSYELQKEINYIHEENFAGILELYSDSLLKIENELNKSLNIIDKYIILSRTNKDGKIIYVSKAFCDVSGYSKDELLGKNHNILKDPSFKKETYADLWKTISQGKFWQGEIRNINKFNKKYWVDVTIEPSFDEFNQVIAYDSISHKISLKKELEEQQQILIAQSKSAAMGEMISLIAHQWKQPLQTLSILVQKLPLSKLSEGIISEELIDGVVVDASKQIDYMSKTIDDFRDFFKPNKIKKEIQASLLIKKALNLLTYMIHINDIELIVNIKDEVYIKTHINEMVQVFLNIIKNAKDILIQRDVVNKRIIINQYKKDKEIVFEIYDNAGGILEQNLTKIFQPYFSTKSNKEGTGLGLYMAQTIVKDHCNGQILVENNKDGAIFTIKLPLT